MNASPANAGAAIVMAVRATAAISFFIYVSPSEYRYDERLLPEVAALVFHVSIRFFRGSIKFALKPQEFLRNNRSLTCSPRLRCHLTLSRNCPSDDAFADASEAQLVSSGGLQSDNVVLPKSLSSNVFTRTSPLRWNWVGVSVIESAW